MGARKFSVYYLLGGLELLPLSNRLVARRPEKHDGSEKGMALR